MKVLRLGAVLVVAAMFMASCSTSTSRSSSTTTTSIPAKAIPPGTVTIAGKSVVVPTEVPGQAINPVIDSAVPLGVQVAQVILAKDGVIPAELLTRINQEIVFTNLTPKAIRFTFQGLPVRRSPWIAPGSTWSMSSPGSISLWFTTSTGYQGHLNIGPFGF